MSAAAGSSAGVPTAADFERERVWPRPLTFLTVLTIIAVLIGLYMALIYAGRDVVQGDVQRIFYIHMPIFFGAFLAFAVAAVGGVLYLRTGHLKWDAVSLAGVEVGIVLAAINLVTGMVWARPTWNTWWTWDPRLTSSAIMTLTYAAYFMLRNGIENPHTRRRFSAIYAIVAILTAVMTIAVIRIRPDTIHPTVIGQSPQNAQGGFVLEGSSSMGAAFSFNMVVWAVLVPVTLLWHRLRLQKLMLLVDALKARLYER
jgi:heme exporter protein C